MSRTVRAAGGVITAVALVVVLAFAYLNPGDTRPTTAAPSAGSSSSAGSSGAGSSSEPGSSSGPGAAPTCIPPATGADGLAWVCLGALPRQAQETVALIDAGGPFPYAKDGATFNNFEGVLPRQTRGYYREYTVRTPGERDRGARRIVSGDRERELFYTADHYDSFVRVQR